MTQAPLAVVAAPARNLDSFGAVIAFILLKEKVVPLRIAAACGIAAGAILLRLSYPHMATLVADFRLQNPPEHPRQLPSQGLFCHFYVVDSSIV